MPAPSRRPVAGFLKCQKCGFYIMKPLGTDMSVALTGPPFGRLHLLSERRGRGRWPARSLGCVSDRRNRETDKLVGPADDQTFLSVWSRPVVWGGGPHG